MKVRCKTNTRMKMRTCKISRIIMRYLGIPSLWWWSLINSRSSSNHNSKRSSWSRFQSISMKHLMSENQLISRHRIAKSRMMIWILLVDRQLSNSFSRNYGRSSSSSVRRCTTTTTTITTKKKGSQRWSLKFRMSTLITRINSCISSKSGELRRWRLLISETCPCRRHAAWRFSALMTNHSIISWWKHCWNRRILSAKRR